MSQIRLIFLWHQHQPYYKDLVTGEYRLPWVRMHALKDYYGMVKLLDEFPRVHQNFNLVPSLIVQIEDYLRGTAHDPFLEVAKKPVRELTPKDKLFALDYLFQANPVHMIARYPRYRELWERYKAAGFNASRAVDSFSIQDFADLQVLSQMAWFDEFFVEKPDVVELVKKGRSFTEEDQRFVIAKEKEIIAAVLPAHADAARRGSIEISTSPFYHPIMPLLCDTNVGAVSNPALKVPQQRFQHPEDAKEQLIRGLDLHERVFGVRPRGVWPSEGSVSEQVLEIGSELGVNWMATDEGVLGRSLGVHFDRDGGGKLQGDGADRLYQMYRYEKGSTRMHMVFRDHALSDLIGFVYSGMPAKQAAEDFIRRIKQSADVVLKRGRDAVVPVILDGENAWEYYPGSGREFLRRLYDAIQRDPVFDPVTVSEAIERQSHPASKPISEKRAAALTDGFGRLESVTPGSWINANFNVWIGAPEDNKSWDYLQAAREFYNIAAARVPTANRELAFEELLIAEGSDWNWWYGPEHHTANDRDFDELYRKHLSNVYQALGGITPDYLAQPIAGAVARPSFVGQTAYIRPRLSTPYARYFDWLGAAMYTADRRAGAMHGKQFLLDAAYAGIDEANVYGRLDFAEAMLGPIEIVANCEASNGVPTEKGAVRVEADIDAGKIVKWKLRLPATRTDAAVEALKGVAPPAMEPRDATVAGSDQRRHRGVEMRVRERSFEFKLPFEVVGAKLGSTLRLKFSVWRERLPIDALPIEGWIELTVTPEDDLEANVYNYGAEN
jgi:alpha-amylase/alpha-mannosidase (GH57 family)